MDEQIDDSSAETLDDYQIQEELSRLRALELELRDDLNDLQVN